MLLIPKQSTLAPPSSGPAQALELLPGGLVPALLIPKESTVAPPDSSPAQALELQPGGPGPRAANP